MNYGETDIKKRVEELTKILNDANYNYYVKDEPTITDQEYDKYMNIPNMQVKIVPQKELGEK